MNNTTNEEVWEDIEGYEGCYQVSNLGRVKSLDRVVERSDGTFQNVKGRMLKQTIRNRYMRVILAKNNKKNHQSVHRLVAKAFIPSEANKPYVNHIDGARENNNCKNLEWVTPLENSSKARESGLYRTGSKSSDSKLTYKEAESILNRYFKKGETQKEIASNFNVTQSLISKVTRGESWHFVEKESLTALRNNLKLEYGTTNLSKYNKFK